MRKRASIVFLGVLATSAAAQERMEVSMPPNSRQAGQYAFANRCASNQTFQVTARPEAGWLHFEPSTVSVRAGTAFEVQVTANTSGIKPGAYRTSLTALCVTCAATEPPCLQGASELPVILTVADIKSPSAFEIVAVPPTPSVIPNNAPGSAPSRRPVLPVSVPSEPVPASKPLIPLAAGGLLMILGGVGAVLALKGKYSTRRRTRVIDAEQPPETERHRVRW